MGAALMAAERNQQRMFAPPWKPKTSTFARPQFHTGMNDAAGQDASQQPRCA
jgi:hypothetical protein